MTFLDFCWFRFFVLIECRKNYAGVAPVSFMNRSTGVAESDLSELLGITAGPCARGPCVTVGVKANAMDPSYAATVPEVG